MAFKLVDPELLTQIRRAEVAKLRFTLSFNQVVARDIVSPTYEYQFNRLDDAIKVTRSKTGKSGARSTIGRDRFKTDMGFAIAEMDFPWAPQWMEENRIPGTLPVPISGVTQPSQAGSLMAEEVLRDLDTDQYERLLALDASPDSIGANDVTTPDGRQAFVDSVLGRIKEMRETYVVGDKVLAVDEGALGYLGLPFAYTDGTGTAIPTNAATSAIDILNNPRINPGGLQIVPVNNPVMAGKAVLHYRNLDNLAFLHSTPRGVYAGWGQDGDNRVLRVLHHHGQAEIRDNDVTLHTQVLEDLF